ncbi:heme-copper oxidase subunit III [Agrococcus sediminis]|uniref:cytochrome-c oxidase n=1 Tax=Agrococcus sediminis TaxID=2599924 RepID=A0A5M8QCA9_9MICO|nr:MULTISPECIES: cytochrome c oxidase subunit 3 [Agrococcus]KAA6433619.1 heme-copper oxidase subunit III [Agrococcus sediminis]RWR22019.1 heme-copper oxidase subunit III [Agrococcus lahaulensis]UOW00371.1 cytochrome c oxidase subunit 3 [Agrococcus sp. SCSIO52902]
MDVVSTTALSTSPSAPMIRRPNTVAVGTIVWLGSEVMFFAGLFAIYFTLRSMSGDLFATEAEQLNVLFATINTAILLASSFTCQAGANAAEHHQAFRTGSALQLSKWGMVEWFYLTYAMGAVFVVLQVFEYVVLVGHGITLSSNSYGSAFYITTGFHGLHVTGGLFAFLFVIGRAYAVKRFGHKEATSAHVISYYWHFVDVVWIGLYLVIYWLK